MPVFNFPRSATEVQVYSIGGNAWVRHQDSWTVEIQAGSGAVILVDTAVHPLPRDAVRALGANATDITTWPPLPVGMRWGCMFYPAIARPRGPVIVGLNAFATPGEAVAETATLCPTETPTFLAHNTGDISHALGPIDERTGAPRVDGRTIIPSEPLVPPPTRRCSVCAEPGHNSRSCTNPPNVIDKLGIEIEGLWHRDGYARAQSASRAAGGGESGDGSVTSRGCSDRVHRGSEFQTVPGKLEESVSQLLRQYPDEVNGSCGMHVHTSFTDLTVITQLITPEFFAFATEQWRIWGESVGLHPSSEFFLRLNGQNSYCLPNTPGDCRDQLDNDRYRHYNFSAWHEHKTVECRLLPMFQDASLGISAIRELCRIYTAWVHQAASPVECEILADVTPAGATDPTQIVFDLPVAAPDPHSVVTELHIPTISPAPTGYRRIVPTPEDRATLLRILAA